ncbi:MAG: WD40 repeat domain-containing serine/threonine protein kinase, partial [Limisphaerales bacterium]
MSSERDIFLDALDRPQGLARASFLDRTCGVATPLRQAVDALLAHHQEDEFLDQPALDAFREELPASFPSTPRAGGASEKPGDWIGRYRLLEIIGEGGGGTVFLAEQAEPVRRNVALKVVKPGMDTRSVIARFETERQALAMMDHPNIAKVLDAGTTDTGRPFFVMELVRGIRITDYCDENHLTTRERLTLFTQVCRAIQHAHQKGIIHRDVKPSNILVSHHDGVPVPKVIDFGIAKAIDQRLSDNTFFTEFRAFLGTPAYMSPEQAEMGGRDIDTRTDIYSLGVVLYEILTGRTPFDARDLVASGLDGMRRTIREEEPVRPSTRLRTLADTDRALIARRHQAEPARLVGVLTGDLDWIVLKALEKDRTRRFETANALALDVQRYLDDDPVSARPPSAFYRFQKLARRHRVAFATASAVGVALLAGLTLATWQSIEKSRAYQRISESEAYQRRLGDRARRAQQTESFLRRQAQAQELLARQKSYAADINLAQHALAANNLGRARELLENHRPHANGPDLRNWEWAYLWQNCGSDALFALDQSPNPVGTLAASPNGRWVLVGTSDSLTLWELSTRRQYARIEISGFRSETAFAPQQPLLAYSETLGAPFTRRQHRVRLWNTITRQVEAELPLTATCRALAFSADGSLLVTVSHDGHIDTWNVAQAVRLQRVSFSFSSRAANPYGASVRISPDLRHLAVAADGGNLQVIDAETGELAWAAHAAEEQVVALAFSPDSKLLASGAGFVESSIRLWDVGNSREITRLEGHRTWVSSLVFWPDGQTLASSSADQTIRVWDISDIRATPDTPARSTRPRFHGSDVDQARSQTTLRGHQLEVWSLALLTDN